MRLINATQLVNELKWCEVCNLSIEEIINIIDKQPSTYYPAVINIKYLTAEDKNTLFKALKKNGLNTITLYAESDLTERPQGEWIEHNINVPNCTYYQCSVCGSKFTTGKKFCGDCGADMQKGEAE